MDDYIISAFVTVGVAILAFIGGYLVSRADQRQKISRKAAEFEKNHLSKIRAIMVYDTGLEPEYPNPDLVVMDEEDAVENLVSNFPSAIYFFVDVWGEEI